MRTRLPLLAVLTGVVGLVALVGESARVLVGGDILGTLSQVVLYVGVALIVVSGGLAVAAVAASDREPAAANSAGSA
jgi:hypothetical protein